MKIWDSEKLRYVDDNDDFNGFNNPIFNSKIPVITETPSIFIKPEYPIIKEPVCIPYEPIRSRVVPTTPIKIEPMIPIKMEPIIPIKSQSTFFNDEMERQRQRDLDNQLALKIYNTSVDMRNSDYGTNFGHIL